MYDLVQKHWKEYLEGLKTRRAKVSTLIDMAVLDEQIAYMTGTDMAVVVSQSQNEVALMKEKGLDIAPHRIRMVNEKLDEKFKDPDDPFRIVFVCAMWMTGFDVPSCSTIYVDKPMKNHTLMQTIARANRVFRDKFNGLIVDYVGVFRNLERALAIYGAGGGSRAAGVCGGRYMRVRQRQRRGAGGSPWCGRRRHPNQVSRRCHQRQHRR